MQTRLKTVSFFRVAAACVPAAALWAASAAGQSAPAGPRVYERQFSTYLGSAGGELLRDMTVDSQGNLYLAGIAGAPDFPRSPGPFPGESRGGGAMVAKLSPTGRLIWSRVVGGLSESSYFYSVKVDRAGCVFVAGRMGPGFPTTPGALQATTRHPCGFVGKLKPDGSAWVWATYVGTGYAVRDMTMDDEGSLYGVLDYFAESRETLPAEWFAHAFQKTPHGGGNHFGKCDAGVIKISNDGKAIWATWIGGSNGNDWVASLGVGKDHCPAIMLNSSSPDLPTTPGAFCKTSPDPRRQAAGSAIPWVGKLSEDGSRLLFGTYLGVSRGTPFARTHNVAIDAQGNTFVSFQGQDDLPTTPGAFQAKFGGGRGDAAIEKISPTGALLAATYVGGSGEDASNGPDQMMVDGSGNVAIACCTSSTDYPVTAGAIQPRNAGAGGRFPFDGAVSVLSNDLSRLLYSTYIGGTGDEMARACCLGADGTVCAGGVTTSRDFPVLNAFQSAYGGDPGYGSVPNDGKFPVGWGNGDCWVVKLRPAR